MPPWPHRVPLGARRGTRLNARLGAGWWTAGLGGLGLVGLLGGCASTVRVQTLATDQPGVAAYELRGAQWADLQAQAQRLCPDGAEVLRAGGRQNAMPTSAPRAWQWVGQQASAWLPADGQAQVLITCAAPDRLRIAAATPAASAASASATNAGTATATATAAGGADAPAESARTAAQLRRSGAVSGEAWDGSQEAVPAPAHPPDRPTGRGADAAATAPARAGGLAPRLGTGPASPSPTGAQGRSGASLADLPEALPAPGATAKPDPRTPAVTMADKLRRWLGLDSGRPRKPAAPVTGYDD